ncbi:hypothetical protein TTRE_0000898201 [Trichuris trichiura]|uniref:Uncharacterized protein n=1 Tax=Trichuris trichiura TaxID=36087 RepID=A0A077ZLK4_TRITR|nr:hypothetical protein TTRE_0000898201 [Trichuris trichiura]
MSEGKEPIGAKYTSGMRKLLAFAFYFFIFAGVYAGFCPIDLDNAYQGFRSNGRCVTLIDQDMMADKDLQSLTYNSAEKNCSDFFTNGNLFAFKTSFTPQYVVNASNFTYTFKHALPPAKFWNVRRNTRFINGVKLVKLYSSTQGQSVHASLYLEYSNHTKEIQDIKLSHGYNIIPPGYNLGIDLSEQPFMATNEIHMEKCFTVSFPLSKKTGSRQYSLNIPRNCFSLNTFNAYLCESDPIDWCTVREISPNGLDKICDCAKGKKPELIEVEKVGPVDMTRWYIIYGSLGFLIILVLFGIVALLHHPEICVTYIGKKEVNCCLPKIPGTVPR